MPYRKSKPWGSIKPDAGCVLDRGDPLSVGAIGCWLFNEGGGGIVRNATGFSDGNFVADVSTVPAWTSGKYGRALSFDGSSAYITCGATSPFQVQSNSFSAWINPSNASADHPILTRELITTSGFEWNLSPSTAGKLAYAYFDGGVQGFFESTGSVSINVWTHVAGVWRQADGFVDFYINGVLDSSVATTTGTIVHNPAVELRIGRRTFNSNKFIGLMDNVRLWNRPLRRAEISLLYSEPFAGIISPRRRIISGIASVDGGRILTAPILNGLGSGGSLFTNRLG